MNSNLLIGGQFTPARSGQFGPAYTGQLKPAQGGQFHRRLHLKTILNYILQIKSKKYRENWKSHFASIILELQEYRNAVVHAGYVNNYSKIKLRDLLPVIMNRARWYIVDTCLKNKDLGFNQIMEKIIK